MQHTSLQHHIADRVMLSPSGWKPLPEGSVNDSWTARSVEGRAAVIRIGPSADVVERGPSWLRANALGCEQHLLNLVRPHLAQVPATIAAGFLPTDRPWAVQECIPGTPLSLVLPELPAQPRQGIWRKIGILLRRLQQIAAPWFGTPDGRKQFFDWVAMVAHDAAGLLADAERAGLPLEPFRALNALVQRHAAELAAIERPRIVHSDLIPRHIFVERGDAGWQITGVIDWEYGRYADPCSEGLLLDMIDRREDDPDRIAFLEGYGPFDSSPAAATRRKIYRGITLGWGTTDAVRCGDEPRRDHVLSEFHRWATKSFQRFGTICGR